MKYLILLIIFPLVSCTSSTTSDTPLGHPTKKQKEFLLDYKKCKAIEIKRNTAREAILFNELRKKYPESSGIRMSSGSSYIHKNVERCMKDLGWS